MNKLLTLLLSSILLSLTGCGGGGGGGSDESSSDSSTSNSSTSNVSSSSSTSTTTPTTPTPPPPVATPPTITLSWSAPTTRADNSPLPSDEIGGYEIYYYLDGTSIDDGQVVNLSNSTTSFTTPPLSNGTYHFAIATFDTNMIYSDLSDPVSATID
mgnify:CR=1 FL=1